MPSSYQRIARPLDACRATSSSTNTAAPLNPRLLLIRFVADSQLGASLAGGVDGVQERSSDPGLLEVPDGHDGGSPRRSHHLPQLDRVLPRVSQHLRRAHHRLDDELGGHVTGQPQEDAGLDHGLGQEEEIGGPRAARRRDSVLVLLRQPDHPPYRAEQSLRDRKSTRLNSSHGSISYAVFCLKKKKN